MLVLILPRGQAAVAQPAVLRGFVTDSLHGQPLASVNVVLHQADSLIAGIVTNRCGLHVFTLQSVNELPFTSLSIEVADTQWVRVSHRGPPDDGPSGPARCPIRPRGSHPAGGIL